MISTASSHHIIADRRGSTLAAALALVFLIFAVAAISLARVASICGEVSRQHNQASALFLAEAGIHKAACRLMQNSAYTGESGTRLATGSFDVRVARSGSGYVITSVGHADSPFKRHPRKTVRATVVIGGKSYAISDWREDP